MPKVNHEISKFGYIYSKGCHFSIEFEKSSESLQAKNSQYLNNLNCSILGIVPVQKSTLSYPSRNCPVVIIDKDALDALGMGWHAMLRRSLPAHQLLFFIFFKLLKKKEEYFIM